MPRMPRRFDEGRVYHVYNRFSRGEPIFEGRQSSRGRAKLAEDPEFAQRFEDLDRALAERAKRESK